MLRRAPTLIPLTNEDVAKYEDSRLKRQAQASTLQAQIGHFNSENARDNAGSNWNSSRDSSSPGSAEDAKGESVTKQPPPFDPNDELKPLPGDKARAVRHAAATGGASASGSGQYDATRSNLEAPNTSPGDRERERARARNERIGVGTGR